MRPTRLLNRRDERQPLAAPGSVLGQEPELAAPSLADRRCWRGQTEARTMRCRIAGMSRLAR